MGKKRYSSKILHTKNKNQTNNSLGPAFFVIPLILLFFIYAIVLSVMEDGNYFFISPVLKRYDMLTKTEDAPMENYFSDEAGMFYDEARHRLINESAEYFYDKTGVKVFLYACTAIEDEEKNLVYPTDKEAVQTCKNICEEFAPEGIDVVILFMPTKEGFDTWTYATDEVKNVFGNKCENILQQYFVHYFHVVGEYDELFWYSYRSAADRLMGGITSPLSIISENLRVFILGVITIAVSSSSIVFYKKYGNRK